MEASSSNNKRIAKNTAFLYVRMLIALIVSLYTSRITLQILGVMDYGVYNVVGGFVLMFGFLNATLSSSIQRFYNYESTLDKEFGYHRVYTTGLIIHAVLCIILLLLLETIGLWYVNNIMVIPSNRIFAANVVYQTAIISMSFVLLQIPYMGVIMAAERMSFYAYISLADVFLKLAIILLLPYVQYDKLVYYSIIILSITIFDFASYFIYAKKYLLTSRFKWKPDKKLFRSMMAFSGWNLLGTFAFLLKGQGLNMVLNIFFGPIINAARGIAYQVNSAICSFSTNMTIAFRPQLVNSYAAGNFERVKKLMFLESKASFLLLAMLMLPITFRIDYILNLWLGKSIPEQTNIFIILLLIDTLICTLNTPISQVAMAVGSIRSFQKASFCVNLLLIPVCWIGLYTGYKAVSVFMFTILFSIINQIVCVTQLKKIFLFSFKKYVMDVCIRSILCCLLLTVLLYILSIIYPHNLIGLILLCVSSLVLCFAIFGTLALNKEERLRLQEKLLSKQLLLSVPIIKKVLKK